MITFIMRVITLLTRAILTFYSEFRAEKSNSVITNSSEPTKFVRYNNGHLFFITEIISTEFTVLTLTDHI